MVELEECDKIRQQLWDVRVSMETTAWELELCGLVNKRQTRHAGLMLRLWVIYAALHTVRV
jgi:hypothetical protein